MQKRNSSHFRIKKINIVNTNQTEFVHTNHSSANTLKSLRKTESIKKNAEAVNCY